MTQHIMRPVEEVDGRLHEIDMLIDIQCRHLGEQIVAKGTMSLIESVKFSLDVEFSDESIPEPPDGDLSVEEPKWLDGYMYGLLLGYWRALRWVAYELDTDLLDDITHSLTKR